MYSYLHHKHIRCLTIKREREREIVNKEFVNKYIATVDTHTNPTTECIYSFSLFDVIVPFETLYSECSFKE